MPSATASGVPPVRAIRSVVSREAGGTAPPCSRTKVAMESVAPLRSWRPSRVDAAHPRVGGERNEVAPCAADVAAAKLVLLLGEHDDRSAFRRFVGQARQLRGVGQLRRSTPASGMNSTACRLPSVMVPVLSSSSVFTSPDASTALPLIASTLCCITRSMPAMPMADSRPPMVVGIRQTSSDTSTATVGIDAGAGGRDAVDRDTAAA